MAADGSNAVILHCGEGRLCRGGGSGVSDEASRHRREQRQRRHGSRRVHASPGQLYHVHAVHTLSEDASDGIIHRGDAQVESEGVATATGHGAQGRDHDRASERG